MVLWGTCLHLSWNAAYLGCPETASKVRNRWEKIIRETRKLTASQELFAALPSQAWPRRGQRRSRKFGGEFTSSIINGRSKWSKQIRSTLKELKYAAYSHEEVFQYSKCNLAAMRNSGGRRARTFQKFSEYKDDLGICKAFPVLIGVVQFLYLSKR